MDVRVKKQMWLNGRVYNPRVYKDAPQELVDLALDEENSSVIETVNVGEKVANKDYSPSFISIEEFKALKGADQVKYINKINVVPSNLGEDDASIYKGVLLVNLESFASVAKAQTGDLIEEILSAVA